MVCVVAPVFHKYEPPAPAANTVDSPSQNERSPVITGIGKGFNVTVTVSELTDPTTLVSSQK